MFDKGPNSFSLRSFDMIFHNGLQNHAIPNDEVRGANMGPIWGRQDPGWPLAGPMNFAIWDAHHI